MPELHRKIFFLEWGHLLIVLFCQHLLSDFTKMFCLIIVFIIRYIEYHKMCLRKRNCVYIRWFVSGWKPNAPRKNVWLVEGFYYWFLSVNVGSKSLRYFINLILLYSRNVIAMQFNLVWINQSHLVYTTNSTFDWHIEFILPRKLEVFFTHP